MADPMTREKLSELVSDFALQIGDPDDITSAVDELIAQAREDEAYALNQLYDARARLDQVQALADEWDETITLPVETARELTYRTEVDGWKVVRNEYADSSRWNSSYELVIERGGRFYRARYERGLTEDQQTGPFEFGYAAGVEFGLVEKRTRMVEVVDYIAPAEQDGAGR